MKRRYPWGVRAALAGCVGTAPAVVYLLTGMVGPWWALFLAGVGGFLGVATTLPGMSVGRVGRVAAAIALGPVSELAGWPAPDTLGPRPPAPPPGPPPGPAVDPRWRTADVVALARGIAADRAWDRLPLLADALMDAGCDDGPILAHCRQPGLCRNDSWVVNILLGPQGAAEPGRAPDRGGGK